MIRKILNLLFLLLPIMLLGQSPGGVAAPDFWVKSDDAGTIATAWKDQSANADNIPNVGGITLSPADRAHNFHPYTTGYSASKYFYNPASVMNPLGNVELPNTNTSIFSAVRPVTAGPGRIIGIDDDLYAAEPGMSIQGGFPRQYEFYAGTTGTNFSTTFNISVPNVFSAIANNSVANGGTSTSSGGEKVLGLNGVYETTPYTGTNRFQIYGINLKVGHGGWDAAGAFPGDIMEVVWYNRLLTPNEQSRVNSYLAVKNGTTLNENYLSTTSSVIWDRTNNTGYNNNIFGIARDNASALHQKQAASTGVNQKLVIGHGSSLFESNADNTNTLTEGQFLLTGDNGLKQSLSIPFAYTSGTNGETNFRLESVWKIQNTNSVGTVTIAWPKGIQNLYLVQSSDETFATGNTYTPMATEVTINGVAYNTTTATLADGQFFTFAGYVQAPGGVVAGILMWHKADDGTATPGAKNIWLDYSGNDRDVTQPDAAAREPNLILDAYHTADSKDYFFNFNPFYYFDGGDVLYRANDGYFPASNSPGSIYGIMMNGGTGTRTAYSFSQNDNRPSLTRVNAAYRAYSANTTFTAAQAEYSAITIPAHIGSIAWTGSATGVSPSINGHTSTGNVSININMNGPFSIGSQGTAPSEAHLGGLPEVFAYSVDHQNSVGDEKQRINSYLAIKYGITLSNNDGTAVPDYLSSGSATVWNATANADYSNNILGIAHDFPSALYQKQSRSANEVQKLIIGAGSALAETNAANTNTLSDGQFLIVGDNGLKQSLVTPLIYTGGSNGEVNFRFESVWKVQNTNSVGQVTIAWPVGINNLYVVQSTDETFATGNTYTSMATEVTINGVAYNTATVTLADGQFFTFAGYAHAPGGVVGQVVWLRADKDITVAAGKVDAWTNQGLSGGDAVPAYPATGKPNFVSLAHNFNPVVMDNTTAHDGLVLPNVFSNTLQRALSSFVVQSQPNITQERTMISFGNNIVPSSATDDPWFASNNATRFNVFWQSNGGASTQTFPNSLARLNNIQTINSYFIPQYIGASNTSRVNMIGMNGSRTNFNRNGNANTVMGNHLFVHQDGGNNNTSDGSISEVISYDKELNTDEQQRIDSYLAIKYGITLYNTAGTATPNYVGSFSNIVWDASANTLYNRNIFGIARSDIGGFEQKVSKSVNTGTILTVAKNNDFTSSNLEASRTGLPNDESYLLFGDNNDASTVPYTPTEIGDCGELIGSETDIKLIPRKWLAQRTNNIGTTYLQVNLASYASTLNSGIYMFVADDSNFTQNVLMVPGTNDGNNWTFAHNFDNEAATRYITFGGTFVAAPCEQCQGGTYNLRTGYQWNQGRWANQTANAKTNILLGNDADGVALYASMYADFTENPSIEYIPTRYPAQYGGKWTTSRRYDNTNAKARHRIEFTQAMKASFQISNINTYRDNKNNFEVIGYCNNVQVMPKITYAYNTSYHTFTIEENKTIGSMSWRGFVPNVSTANVRFDRPVDRIEIICSVDRVNTSQTLRSILYSDIALECAAFVEPTPDNVYVSHNFTQETLATCGGETTMRIKVTNNNLCEDKTIDLHQLLPTGLTYVAGSFNGNDLPAGAMSGATLNYSGSSLELSGLTLPRGEHWMYVDVANPGSVGTYPTQFTFEVTDGLDPDFEYSSSIVNLNYYESTDPAPAAPQLTYSIKDNVSCGENNMEITYRMKIDNPNSGGITGAEIFNMFDYDQTIENVVYVTGEDEDGVITGNYPEDGSGNPIEPIGNSLFNLVDAVIPEGVSYIDITVNVGNSYDIPEVQAVGISSSFLVGFGSGECAESAESISNEAILLMCSPCTNLGATGTALGSNVGISTKQDRSVTNWPASVPNGYLVLEGAFKGMVITHMSTDQINALTPLKGMLVYDTDAQCVKLYRGAGANAPVVHPSRQGWVCIERVCID